MTGQIAKLVKRLRQELPEGKLITMATFSVAADPAGACTVPGSAHCGEIINLLNQVGDQIDIINVMAYDAGLDFAGSGYKTAMKNYYDLVGAKAVLGLDN